MQPDPFHLLPDDVVVRIFKPFSWHGQSHLSERVQLSDGTQVKMLAALCLTCTRFRKLITEGSPLWDRVELTGIETCWRDATLQDSFLRWLKPKQSSIRELVVATTPSSIIHNDSGVITLLTSLAPQLRTAGIHAVIPAASITALGQCIHLTELHLNCESDFDLAPLSHLRKLQRIVTFLPGVIPEDFPLGGASLMPWLVSLPLLQDLTIQGVPEHWATQASALHSLRSLSLAGYSVNDHAPKVFYSGLTSLGALTQLQVIGSPFHVVGDADSVMAAAARMSTLQRLVLHNCSILSVNEWCPSLHALGASLKCLEVHELWGLAGPMQLSRLHNLRALSFSKPEIPGIAGLSTEFRADLNSAWHNLQELSLQNCDLTSWPRGVWLLQHLRRLNLSRNRLSGITPRLAKLNALRELVLRENDGITVVSAVVCAIPNLAVLDVRDCEPVLLEGSLHRVLRHVPAFHFSCLRTKQHCP